MKYYDARTKKGKLLYDELLILALRIIVSQIISGFTAMIVGGSERR
jgi:hypothetical protein